jgi:hypothetical protein
MIHLREHICIYLDKQQQVHKIITIKTLEH